MVASVGLGLPFVPFTFPTVMFGRLAAEMGYPSLTWGVIDRIWSVYRRGRESGEIRDPGYFTSAGAFNREAIDYLVAEGIERDAVQKWLVVADEAASRWWGQGTFFDDFGGAGGVLGAVEGVAQGAVDVVKSVGGAIVGGVARSFGIPRWIVVTVVVLVVALVGFVVVRAYFPRALRFR